MVNSYMFTEISLGRKLLFTNKTFDPLYPPNSKNLHPNPEIILFTKILDVVYAAKPSSPPQLIVVVLQIDISV